jgi:hypothetical protein
MGGDRVGHDDDVEQARLVELDQADDGDDGRRQGRRRWARRAEARKLPPLHRYVSGPSLTSGGPAVKDDGRSQ